MNEKQSGWKPWWAGKQMLCPNGGGASILQPIDVCRNTEAMEWTALQEKPESKKLWGLSQFLNVTAKFKKHLNTRQAEQNTPWAASVQSLFYGMDILGEARIDGQHVRVGRQAQNEWLDSTVVRVLPNSRLGLINPHLGSNFLMTTDSLPYLGNTWAILPQYWVAQVLQFVPWFFNSRISNWSPRKPMRTKLKLSQMFFDIYQIPEVYLCLPQKKLRKLYLQAFSNGNHVPEMTFLYVSMHGWQLGLYKWMESQNWY